MNQERLLKILEDLCSIILKEVKKFKIGMTLSDSLVILKEEEIIDENLYKVLNKSRIMRNRISHRYKEPSFEDLYKHLTENINEFRRILDLANSYAN